MIEPSRLSEMERELCALMAARLGVERPDLVQSLRALGRRLPRRQRRVGAELSAALAKAAHPQLYAQLDGAAILKTYGRLKTYLEQIDGRELRRRRWIRAGAALAFNLLAVLAGVIVVLRLRSFV